jgi:lipopolysaccharide/colanic/teichoic acid biosynthesis glycosyltransferase
MKRALDLLLSGLGLVVLAPVFLVVALLIKLDSPGPVFFRQERVGRHGRVFRIFKFRTMTAAAAGPQITVGADARITRVGAVLRRYKLDELAQLIDVFRGTMSLVGPRPEVPRYVEVYPAGQRERVLSVRPGITDFASLRFRSESELLAQASDPEAEYVNVILPEKLRVAVDYVDHATLAGDLRVLGLTLKTVFVPERPARTVRHLMQHKALWTRIDRLFGQAHARRVPLAVLLDSLIVLVAWHITYLFRLGFERWQPDRPWYDNLVSAGVVAVYLIALQISGARASMWRYFAFDDFRRLAIASGLAGLVSAVAVQMAQLSAVPRAVLVLHPLFALSGMVLARVLYRMLQEHASAVAHGESGESRYVVVLGSGDLARRVVAGLHQRHGWHVMMLLDDDTATHATRICGVRVEGGLDRLRDPALMLGATHAVVALEDGETARVEEVVRLAQACGLTVMTIPGPQHLQAWTAPTG